MRVAFVSPIAPTRPGTGLAHRARMWQAMLADLGEVTTIVVPVADERGATPDPDAITLTPEYVWHEWHPRPAHWASKYSGARWSTELGSYDLVVALRAYTGPFAEGFARGCGARWIVDLDDDDVAYLTDRGEADEANRYRWLIAMLAGRADALTSATGFGPTWEIPNAYPAGDPMPWSRPDGPPRIVCVGNFTYPPNFEGGRWLVDEVLPIVRLRLPDVEAMLVGPGSEALDGGVGLVDDLTDVYRSATIAVVPIRHGSGTRIKLLEAWHHGVPVASTVVGATGLVDTSAPQGAILADGPYDFATAITDIATDDDLAARLVAEGRKAAGRFDPAVVGARVRTLVELVMEGRPAHPPPRPVPDVIVTEQDDGLVVDDEANATVHHLDPVASMVYALAADAPTIASIADELSVLLDRHPPPDDLVLDALAQLERINLVAPTTVAPVP